MIFDNDIFWLITALILSILAIIICIGLYNGLFDLIDKNRKLLKKVDCLEKQIKEYKINNSGDKE